MTREEKIEYLAKAAMALSELGDNKTAYALNEIRLEMKGQTKLPEGPEEAAENYIAPIENDEGLDYINFNGRDIKDAFIAGAEWQKKRDDLETADLLAIAHLQGMEQQKAKMLDDAVEGEVVKDINNKLAVTAKNVNLDKFKFGDKVRIIIVKEYEK